MIIRRAILIGCPGNGEGYLNGVKKDIQSMSNYLCSPKGGQWSHNEITSLFNCSWIDAQKLIEKTIADYLVVYFSGHGLTDHLGNRLTCFGDTNVPDVFLLNKSKRQLVIVDACRSYMPSGIGAISEAAEAYDSFDGPLARRYFDNYIANSPNGKIIVHATHQGVYAFDVPSGKGGAFTLSLLHFATNITTKKEFAPVYIDKMLPHVGKLLQTKGYNQNPCIPYAEGNFQVPFMIGAQQVPKDESNKIGATKKENQVANALGLGLVLWGLYKILK